MEKILNNQSCIWFTEPAKRFEEALPIGNGHIGIMDYGNGRFLINEESLWSGSPEQNPKEDQKNKIESLNKVRELILAGNIEEGESLLTQDLLGNWKETYLPFGELHIRVNQEEPRCHQRILDLTTGVSKSYYQDIVLSSFVSSEDQVFVLGVESKDNQPVDVDYQIQPFLEGVNKNQVDDLTIFTGFCPLKVPSYDERNQEIEYTQSTKTIQYALVCKLVKKEHSQYLFLTIVTNYLKYGKLSGESDKELSNRGIQRVNQAASKPYSRLLTNQLAEMNKLFSRTTVDFKDNEHSDEPTDVRRLRYREDPTDYSLIGLYFHYGRYLLYQSSRQDSLPANLQGIWNEHIRAPWCSNYTTNINLQMNYWHAEVCRLEDSHDALLNLLMGMSKMNDSIARLEYDAQGLVINHNLDIWFSQGPVNGSPSWAYWPMASLWLAYSVFERIRGMKNLEEGHNYYAGLKSIASFANHWMIQDEQGCYITCPSTSPENEYILPNGKIACVSYSSTMDIMLLKEFAQNFYSLAQEWNEDLGLAKELLVKTHLLPEIKIHREGYLQEWQHAFQEKDVGHRHLSHLIGFFPGSYMFGEKEAYLDAGKKALLRRIMDGGDFTSWHCTWVINLLARFGEEELARDYVNIMIGDLTCPNLFSSHRRRMDGEELFQIDGNFGGTRAICELMIQDYGDTVKLLPAVLSIIPSGAVSGLKIRNGHLVNLTWKEGTLVEATIVCNKTESLYYEYKGKRKQFELIDGEKIEILF